MKSNPILKIISITVIAMLCTGAVYSKETLRVPVESNERILELAEVELIRQLSSDDIRTIDSALVSLDELRGSVNTVRIIEEVFAKRGLNVGIIKEPHAAIEVRRDDEDRGLVAYFSLEVSSSETLLHLTSIPTENTATMPMLENRLLRLMFRWMNAHQYFQIRLPEWTIRTIVQTTDDDKIKELRAWWDSGFDNLEVFRQSDGTLIKRKDVNYLEIIRNRYHMIECKFSSGKEYPTREQLDLARQIANREGV